MPLTNNDTPFARRFTLVVQQKICKFCIVIFLLGTAEHAKIACSVINTVFFDPCVVSKLDRAWVRFGFTIICGIDQMIFILF